MNDLLALLSVLLFGWLISAVEVQLKRINNTLEKIEKEMNSLTPISKKK
ncbi:hypothetical protein KJ765_02635 [Candidatus Micrarchaeota archaeon]|nr:hypothetical protein [Candidatus Micrarchaeota archaeon]